MEKISRSARRAKFPESYVLRPEKCLIKDAEQAVREAGRGLIFLIFFEQRTGFRRRAKK